MLLSMDVGKGTQDIVLYDGTVRFKAILPSPTEILAKTIRAAEGPLVLYGVTMGGGPLTGALRAHAEKERVSATRDAALSLADDLERVESWGIDIIGEEGVSRARGKKILLSDIDMPMLEGLLRGAGFSLSEVSGFGLALQDHGFSLSSNRVARFRIYRRFLEHNDFRLGLLSFARVPAVFSRARAAMGAIPFKRKLFMDSSYAAVLGAYFACGDCLAVNVGNAHTLAATVVRGRIAGMFEHHTHLLDSPSLARLLRRLARGTLKNEEIFDAGGHGALVRRAARLPIVATGPRREIMERTGLSFSYAYPLGDCMIPGNLALIEVMKGKGWARKKA